MLTHNNPDPKSPRRVAVLGPNGFVGRELIAQLSRGGLPVAPIARDKVDLAAADAADRLAAELEPEDTVIVLSALTPDKGRGIAPFFANLRMGAAILSAIERVPIGHLIYVSSDAVYPLRAALVNEVTCAEPTDLYSAMHLSRELMLKQSAKIPLAILRPTLIYGAGDTHNSYGPNRFRRMAREGKITLFGEGEETRDHIFVEDVAALIVLTALHRSAGMLNLATGRSIAYRDLATRVAALFPSKVEIVGTARQNPVTHRTFDITAIRRAFPKFRFTPLEDGLAAAHRE
jgi:nucleoside-diphosphate-sugar epimerase